MLFTKIPIIYSNILTFNKTAMYPYHSGNKHIIISITIITKKKLSINISVVFNR